MAPKKKTKEQPEKLERKHDDNQESKLAIVAPTDDELTQAQKAIDAMDPAALKKVKANMAHWLKNRAEGGDECKGVRGDDRRKWLEQFWVMRARDSKPGEVETKTKRTIRSQKTSGTDWQ